MGPAGISDDLDHWLAHEGDILQCPVRPWRWGTASYVRVYYRRDAAAVAVVVDADADADVDVDVDVSADVDAAVAAAESMFLGDVSD